MPKRKMSSQKKRSYKRRRLSRRRKGFGRRTIPRGMGSSQVVRMRYVEYFSLDPGVGTPANYVFSATNIYDPNYTGVGHQPMGHDQYVPFFNHYTVLGAKIAVHGNVYNDTVGSSCWLTCKLNSTTLPAATSIDQYIEQRGAAYTFLTTKGGSHSYGKVKATYSPKKFFSLKNPQDEHDLRGLLGASAPAENAYFIVTVGASNPGDDATAINCRAIIDYTVLLSERKALSSS